MSAVVDYVTPAPFVRFDPAGNIVEAGTMGVGFVAAMIARGEPVLMREIPFSYGLADLDHYVEVVARTVRQKTECPATLDGATLRDLPVPCRIEISTEGQPATGYAWTAPTAALTFDHPAEWTVRVRAPAHRDGLFTVSP